MLKINRPWPYYCLAGQASNQGYVNMDGRTYVNMIGREALNEQYSCREEDTVRYSQAPSLQPSYISLHSSNRRDDDGTSGHLPYQQSSRENTTWCTFGRKMMVSVVVFLVLLPFGAIAAAAFAFYHKSEGEHIGKFSLNNVIRQMKGTARFSCYQKNPSESIPNKVITLSILVFYLRMEMPFYNCCDGFSITR